MSRKETVYFEAISPHDRLLWTTRERAFLLRRAGGIGGGGHIHHLTVLKWEGGGAGVELSDEAALPPHLGWTDVRSERVVLLNKTSLGTWEVIGQFPTIPGY